MRSAVSLVVLSWVLVGCGGGDGAETPADPDGATLDALADVTSDVPTDALADTLPSSRMLQERCVQIVDIA